MFACLASICYAVAFAGSLTAGVLYLSAVWHRTPMDVGVLITPGPVLVASLSFVSGRLVRRVPQRYLIAAGSLIFAIGCAWWAARMSATAAPWLTFEPGWVLAGVGIGLSVPSMMSAATGSLPPERLATGSAVVTMCRQLGAALGVAVFVAVLGQPSPHGVTAAYARCWVVMAVAAGAASIFGLAVGVVRPFRAPPACPSPLDSYAWPKA